VEIIICIDLYVILYVSFWFFMQNLKSITTLIVDLKKGKYIFVLNHILFELKNKQVFL